MTSVKDLIGKRFYTSNDVGTSLGVWTVIGVEETIVHGRREPVILHQEGVVKHMLYLERVREINDERYLHFRMELWDNNGVYKFPYNQGSFDEEELKRFAEEKRDRMRSESSKRYIG